MRNTLVVMVKEPRPGRVKSRLGRDIGMTTAAWWFRHQTARLLRRLDDPRWDLVLAVAPDREGMTSRIWPKRLKRLPQGSGDLGDRMARALRSTRSGPVCVIGADVPDISKTHVHHAFRALGDHDAVLGPAPDGGYWLVGLKNARPAPVTMFRDVRWSTAHALNDTLASISGLRVASIDELDDVDTVDDLRMTAHREHAT